MSPSVTAQALLYVLDNTYVTVYSYPQGKLEGRLRHFYLADDACVDTKGDVFIVNLGYGESSNTRMAAPSGLKTWIFRARQVCSIDAASGNLAVAGGNAQGAFIFSSIAARYTDDTTRIRHSTNITFAATTTRETSLLMASRTQALAGISFWRSCQKEEAPLKRLP